MKVWRSVVAAVRDLPDVMADKADRWTLRFHAPEDPGDGTAWCSTCRESWPCDDWTEIDGRLARRGMK